jgi:alpha-galactosidase
MIGSDVRNMSEETFKLLTNKDLIAINQDEEARPPIFVKDNRGQHDNTICFKHLANNEYAIAFFNPSDKKRKIMLPYYEIGLDPLCGYGFEVKDCFTGENLGVHKEYLDMYVEAGDCRVFRAKLVPVK